MLIERSKIYGDYIAIRRGVYSRGKTYVEAIINLMEKLK